MKINWTATFLVKMAQQRICKHTEGVKEQVYLHKNYHHLHLEYPVCYVVKMQMLKFLRLMVYYLNRCIYILLLPMLYISIVMH
jgi:hypothetical protein